MSLNRNGFQTRVNRNPSPAVIGQFASMNPRATVLGGAGQYRSGNGTTYLSAQNLAIVGSFAWFAGQLAGSQKPPGASILGFVANELQTIIPFPSGSDPAYPNVVRLAVENGFPVTGFTHCDAWTVPVAPVSGIVSPGDEVYARAYDGAPTNDPVEFSATAVQTASSANVTISAVTKGALVPGVALQGTGIGTAPLVVSQTSGTPGGAGVYVLNETTGFASATVTVNAVDTLYKWASQTVAGASFTGVIDANGVLTASSVTGTIGVPSGDVDAQNVSGVGVPANLFVVSQLSGTTGGAGTYQTNSLVAVASVAMTTSEAVLAKINRTY